MERYGFGPCACESFWTAFVCDLPPTQFNPLSNHISDPVKAQELWGPTRLLKSISMALRGRRSGFDLWTAHDPGSDKPVTRGGLCDVWCGGVAVYGHRRGTQVDGRIRGWGGWWTRGLCFSSTPCASLIPANDKRSHYCNQPRSFSRPV